MKHCHAPQTQNRLDTYLSGVASVAEPEHWSDAHRFHTDHFLWDTPRNQGYTRSCFSQEYPLCIPHLLHDTHDLFVDTRTLWLHRSKTVFHGALAAKCEDDLFVLAVHLGQSTWWHRKSIVPVSQILHLLGVATLYCIHGVRRTYSKLASACSPPVSHQGAMDAGKADLYTMIFLYITPQFLQRPLMRLSIQLLVLVRCLLQHRIPLCLCPLAYLGWSACGLIWSKFLKGGSGVNRERP